MRIVFVTHNQVGATCIETLASMGADIEAVYTRPETEALADQRDLDDLACEVEADLHYVEDLNDKSITSKIRSYEPELLFVVGWSRLVSSSVIECSSVATLGMHPAPLPRGRGRAPIAWTLIKGLDNTALSMFHLVPEADAGDIVEQHPIAVEPTDDAGSLHEKVVDAAAELVRDVYLAFEQGEMPRTPQDDEEATWWPKRTPDHGLIDWTQSPRTVYNWIRGQTHPYPGAFSYLDGRKVTIWAANQPNSETVFAKPGELLATEEDAVTVAAWEGSLDVTRVQVEDGPELPASALLTEYDFSLGDTFVNAREKR